MSSKTKNLIKEIRSKLKSKVTGYQEFSGDEEVIDVAVKLLYQDLKHQRLI